GEGLNINITLLFSQQVYEQVAEAYLAGLEEQLRHGADPRKIASVASFFVSRIDSAVDKQIDEKLRAANGAAARAALTALKGRIAIANAKLAYRRYKRLFAGPRWEALRDKGARPQRLLWASTGTKNPDYSDVLYVEELIGRDTINTMPLSTLQAFREHGKLRDSLEEGVDAAAQALGALEQHGISLDAITAALTDDGVRLFDDAEDKLLGAVARKRAALLGPQLDRQQVSLPPEFEKPVASVLEDWRRGGKI